MSRRNLNEVLGFISRWGDSHFSIIIKESTVSTKPKSLEDRMAEDEGNPSIFYTSALPRGARFRKPGEKESAPILGGAMNKLGRLFGKAKNRIAPKGSRTSKVLGGIARAGKGLFKGVGSSITDLLTSEDDYDYIAEPIITQPIKRKKKTTDKSSELESPSMDELPPPKESGDSPEQLPEPKQNKSLPAPEEEEEEEKKP